MVSCFRVSTIRTGFDIVGDESIETWPCELFPDVADRFTYTWMAGKTMVVERSEDVKPDIVVIGHVDESFVQEEVTVFGHRPEFCGGCVGVFEACDVGLCDRIGG